MRTLAATLLMLSVSVPATAGIEVKIEGLERDLRENVELRLGILNAAGRADLDQALVERLHEKAPQDIRESLQPFGHYSSTIRAELTGSAPDWHATYTVEAGPLTEVAAVAVQVTGEGAGFEALEPALGRLYRMEGRALRHLRYEEAKAGLLNAAQEFGFLDAWFTLAELRVDPARRRAEVALTLETGPRYTFGAVHLEAEGLDLPVVQRYVQVLEGQPFESRKLLDTQFALTDLDYFDSIEIEPLRDKATGNSIPVEIRTTPRKRARYDVGVGYGTDTGARLTAAAEFRRWNRKGHKVRTDLRLAEQKSTLSAEYRIPLGHRVGEQLSFSGGSTAERFEDGESVRYTLGAGLSRIPGDWQRRLYLNFEHEDSELGGEQETSDLLMPGISFTRSELDDPVHTRRGWFFFADLHGAHRDLLSTATFLQLRAQGRLVLPLGWRARVLGRGELGANFVQELSELPASQRFFAGGDQSVRGYKYQSLGPRDAAGRVIGGEYLSTFSVEADYRVWRQWGAAVFYDAGGAADDPGPKLFQAVGVGLRYRAPVGNVQLDLAYPLDGDDRGVRLHLGIGVGL